MTKEKILAVRVEAMRFLKKITDLEVDNYREVQKKVKWETGPHGDMKFVKDDGFSHARGSVRGSLRRASMDLTRVLAELRRY